MASAMPAQTGPLLEAMALIDVPETTWSVMKEYHTMNVPSAIRMLPTRRTRAIQKAPTSQRMTEATAAKVPSSGFAVPKSTRRRLSVALRSTRIAPMTDTTRRGIIRGFRMRPVG